MRISQSLRSLYYSGVSFSGTSKKGKKDISDAVNEKSIEKVKQLATQDAIRGKRGIEATFYVNECREKVAPDRKKIFRETEAKMSRSVEKYKKPDRPHDVWEYLLDIVDKTEEGSFKGEYSTVDGHTFIRAYDENGEEIGTYDSKWGWDITYTKLENQAMAALNKIYNDTFREVYHETHCKKSSNTASFRSESRLDVMA